ncbi:UNVERIFIED_CONTAM: hypothetical protein FKN15_003236 [Acipenser sinensis]
MMSSKDGSNCRTKYTLEALLYKPLDRVTKTTLVLHIRQLVKDGFLVDLSDGTRSLRHVFLFTDLILCAKLKAGWVLRGEGAGTLRRGGWFSCHPCFTK